LHQRLRNENSRIVIVDYGMGNIQSIYNAFEVVGEKACIVNDPSELSDAKAIILPGVGAFSDGIKNLQKLGFIDPLEEEVLRKGKPYLGICLGMQFLARESHEHGLHKGFGWIPGAVKKIEPSDPGFKVPHMGWNNVKVLKKDDVLFAGLGENPVFYFVHSYHLEPEEAFGGRVTSTSWHGTTITASVRKDNIFGVQFHPEKSQGAGLKLLENFVALVNRGDLHS